VQNKKMS